MLKVRIVSALLLIPVVLALIWDLSLIYFDVALSVFIVLSAWEWSKLAHWSGCFQSMAYVVILGLCVAAAMLMALPLFMVVPLLVWFIAIYLVFARAMDWPLQMRQSKRWAWMGWVILSGAWLSLSWIKQLDGGSLWLTFVLVATWAVDTGAYFSGKFLGRGRGLLLPRVSPKKTWAGVLGGMFLVILVTALFLWLHPVWRRHWLEFLLLDLLIVFAAIMGDLFESVLKRVSGVKDSGTIIPGHGGILDRIDSLLAVAPVVFFAIKCFGW